MNFIFQEWSAFYIFTKKKKETFDYYKSFIIFISVMNNDKKILQQVYRLF